MHASPYEIILSKTRFRNSDYPRPWLVVSPALPDPQDPSKQVVLAVSISTKFDLFDERAHFEIEATDPDFKGTGLDARSYVVGDLPAWISTDSLERKLGELRGI